MLEIESCVVSEKLRLFGEGWLMRSDVNEVDPVDEPDAVGSSSLNRHSFADRIYSQLRTALMAGLYEPGSRLNIRRLAIVYETSQTPVREAIIQLVADGALELKLGHQPRVPILTIPRYIEIRETRAPLERLAAELSTVNITRRDIEFLEQQQVEFLRAEAEQDWKKALATNQAFHFAIYRKSNNQVLIKFIENLWLLAGPFVNNQYPYSKKPAFDVHPHELIIDALKRRSPTEAGELVVRDLREGSYRILEKLKHEALESKPKKPKTLA